MIWTRPDTAIAVDRLFQYMKYPTVSIWTCVERVFRFIKGTSTFGIPFNGQNWELTFEGYCDGDWADCKNSRNC